MDYIFANVSKLLIEPYRIVLNSKLTHTFISQEYNILWNEEPLTINSETYLELKEALKKRGSKYYTRSDILSYHDFCIALLCCSNYSLNHTNTLLIESRAYTAAWRALVVVSSTGSSSVTSWINKYIGDRNSEGYNTTFMNSADFNSRRSSSVSTSTIINNPTDEEIIASMSTNENVVEIEHYKDNVNNIGVFSTTYTPEGQLDNLRTVWNVKTDG